MTSQELLELAYERGRYRSWRQMELSCGFSDGGFRHIRKGFGLPSDELTCTLAAIAGVDPYTALLQLNVERSEGTARRIYEKALRDRTPPSIAAE